MRSLLSEREKSLEKKKLFLYLILILLSIDLAQVIIRGKGEIYWDNFRESVSEVFGKYLFLSHIRYRITEGFIKAIIECIEGKAVKTQCDYTRASTVNDISFGNNTYQGAY